MSARLGMATLIRRLRGLTQVGATQYTIGTVVWWSDDHCQEALDANVVRYYDMELIPQYERNSSGQAQYFTYKIPAQNFEEADSGTVQWCVYTAAGSVIGTANYSADYIGGWVRFNADTAGTAYLLRGRAYNLNRAAAQIWTEMAGNTAAMYSFQSDNQKFDRGQWFDHCMKMASRFEAKSGFTMTRMNRADLMPSGGLFPAASTRLSDGGIPAGDDD